MLLTFVISLITFVLFFALPPNQPGSNRQGQVTPNLQTQFNLDGRASFAGEYRHFLDRVVRHGDLGRSLRQPRSVREIIGKALPVTASLLIGGTIVCLVLAFSIGLLSALRPRSPEPEQIREHQREARLSGRRLLRLLLPPIRVEYLRRPEDLG